MDGTRCLDTKAYKDLPRYQCFKVVHALKIVAVSALLGCGALLQPEDERFASFEVDAEFVAKHKPRAGGYYVVYKDGYKSFSPAEAFEDGYTLIPN